MFNYKKMLLWHLISGLFCIFILHTNLCASIPSKPTYYIKKSSWQETMRVSRNAMLNYFRRSNKKSNYPIQVSSWFVTDPLPAKGLKEAFFPEDRINLYDRDSTGKLLWQPKLEFTDGIMHELPGEIYTTTYLYRKIVVPEEITVVGSFSGKDGTIVWLNGEEIIHSEIFRGLIADKDRAQLNLDAGENHLLMKTYLGVGKAGFYFKILPEPLSLATFLWPWIEHDFTDEQSRREIGWEKNDGIWSVPLKNDGLADLLKKYITSIIRPTFRKKAIDLAKRNDTQETIDKIRQLYYQDHWIDETWNQIKDFNFVSLQKAIHDLKHTFPKRYTNADIFLSHLSDIEQEYQFMSEFFKKEQETELDEKKLYSLGNKLLSLQKEALCANPLVCSQPILYVVRQQYWGNHGPTNTTFQNGEDFAGGVGGLKAWRSEGSALKMIFFSKSGETKWNRTLIERPLGMIRDPDVRFDGKKILLSMRDNKEDDYHIFEININGDSLKQLTWGSELADSDPVYLPDGHIVFSSTRDPKYCHCNIHIQPNLFKMESDGANIVNIGGSNLWEGNPSVMSDGRILYSRWEYVDRQFGPSYGLWTMNPDGTTQTLFYGNNAWTPSAILDGRDVPGTNLVSCIFSGIHNLPWGAMAIIDRRRGMDGSDPVMHIWPAETRNLLEGLDNIAWTPYKIDLFHYPVPKYEDPYPLSDPETGHGSGKYFLVSRSIGKVIHHFESTTKTNASYANMGIFLVDVFGNEILLHSEEPGCYDPLPVTRKPKPIILPSKVDYTKNEGYFYLEDIYQGSGMEKVPKGTIKYLRIIEAPPKRHWAENGWGIDAAQPPAMNWNVTISKAIIGDVPVESDGSAYFSVPANRFIYFQALDEEKMMIQSMRSGTMLQPGEMAGCIGCHENRLQSAYNKNIQAMNRTPNVPESWYGPSRNFNYFTEVQPVFDKHCVRCHDYNKPAGSILNLAGDPGLLFNASYVDIHSKSALRWYPDTTKTKLLIKVIHDGPPAVLPPYSWGSHCSRLIDVLKSGHQDVRLSKEDIERIITWIDLNAPYYGVYSAFYADNLFARSPLTKEQLHRLSELLNMQESFANLKRNFSGLEKKSGSQFSFSRPEFSPILLYFNKHSPAYQEALAIIRSGQTQLERQPREDMLGCSVQPIREADLRRYQRYLQQAHAEAEARKAIIEHKKSYVYRPKDWE